MLFYGELRDLSRSRHNAFNEGGNRGITGGAGVQVTPTPVMLCLYEKKSEEGGVWLGY